MGQPATFSQSFGIETVDVACSALWTSSGTTFNAIRDGKSGIVSASAYSGSTGIFTLTLAKKFPRVIAMFAQVNTADATPTDVTCQCSYNATTGVVTIYTTAAAVLTNPETGARISFFGKFSSKDYAKDAA